MTCTHLWITSTLVLLLSGCTATEDVGPLRVSVLVFEAHPEVGRTATFTTRITNIGSTPIHHLRVSPSLFFTEDNGSIRGSAVERNVESDWSLTTSREVLRPRSYVDRTLSVAFGEPVPWGEGRTGQASYYLSYVLDYQTPGRTWRMEHFACNRTPGGEEIPRAGRCRDPWFIYEIVDVPTSIPENATYIGEPLPERSR